MAKQDDDCCRWGSYSIKTQMLITFLGMTGLSLITIMAVSLLYVNLLNEDLKSESREALVSQSIGNVVTAADESFQLLTSILERAEKSVVNVAMHAASDTFRTDYSMDPIPNQYDLNDEPFMATEFVAQLGGTANLNHSASYFPSYQTNSSLTTFLNAGGAGPDEVTRTSNVDPFLPTVYETNPDFVLVYYGFEASGLFRTYPGKKATDRTYDPRVRPWYTAAKKSPADTMFTEPYVDAFGLGWMISLARAVRHPSTNAFLGVASSDMLISSIITLLSSTKFQQSGKLTLFHLSSGAVCDGSGSSQCGIVVADKEFNLNATNVLLHSDLKNPPISAEVFAQLASAPAGEPATSMEFENAGKDWIAAHGRLAAFGGHYLIAAFVPKDEVIAPVKGVEDEMDKVAQELSIILAAVFLVVTIFMVLVIFLSTRAIVRPIERLSKASQRIASNIGKGNILEDVELEQFDHKDGLGNETAALNAVAGSMLHGIRDAQEKAAHADEMENPYFHNQNNAWLSDIKDAQAYPAMFMAGQPVASAPMASAPPAYSPQNPDKPDMYSAPSGV